MWKKFFMVIMVLFFVLEAKEPTLLTRYAKVSEIYVATFNRASDTDGLTYWVNSGDSIKSIAKSFFYQPETEQTYPSSVSNEEFVITIYNNVFNRGPDNAGLTYWVNSLESGEQSRDTCILATINGAQGDDNLTITGKATVGVFYAFYGYNNLEFSKEVMANVGSDMQTVYDAINMMYIRSGDPAKGTSCVMNIFTEDGRVGTRCIADFPAEQCMRMWGDYQGVFSMTFPVYGSCIVDLHYPKESEEIIDGDYTYTVFDRLFWGIGKSLKP